MILVFYWCLTVFGSNVSAWKICLLLVCSMSACYHPVVTLMCLCVFLLSSWCLSVMSVLSVVGVGSVLALLYVMYVVTELQEPSVLLYYYISLYLTSHTALASLLSHVCVYVCRIKLYTVRGTGYYRCSFAYVYQVKLTCCWWRSWQNIDRGQRKYLFHLRTHTHTHTHNLIKIW